MKKIVINSVTVVFVFFLVAFVLSYEAIKFFVVVNLAGVFLK